MRLEDVFRPLLERSLVVARLVRLRLLSVELLLGIGCSGSGSHVSVVSVSLLLWNIGHH